MKKLLLMVVAAFTLGATVHAQTQQKTEPTKKEFRQQHRGNRFAQLNLTPDQKTQMQKIRQENMQQRKAIKDDKSLTDQQRSAKMKELNKANKKEMDKVLTKEQKEQMKTARQSRKNGKMMQNRKGKPAVSGTSTGSGIQ